MFGYCGQELKNGVCAVYVENIGICAVKKSNEPETVVITEILVSADTIAEKILADFKNNKKLAVMVENAENKNVLEVLEIPVNKKTIGVIMESLSLNTAGKKFGVCIRNISDNIEKLSTVGYKVLSFSSDTLGKIANDFAETGANNGNFAEYLLSGNEKDITERFRNKKNDVYVKLDAFKAERRWELKTTLKYTNKSKKSGASNTNMLFSTTVK